MKTNHHRLLCGVLALSLAASSQAATGNSAQAQPLRRSDRATIAGPTLVFGRTGLTGEQRARYERLTTETLALRSETAGASDRTKVVLIVAGVAVVALAAMAISAADSLNSMNITVNP